jgi:hypothetical protein
MSLFPNLPHRKITFLFSSGGHILVQIKTICFQQDKFGNDSKTFWFRFQNDIGTFLLSFLTILVLMKENTVLTKVSTLLTKENTVLTKENTVLKKDLTPNVPAALGIQTRVLLIWS